VGKSALFGALTHRYVTVSNYPGTTVEVTRGHMALGTATVPLEDTPGTQSLLPLSDDERVTRDILLEERDAVVLQVADAKNLPRALHLTVELAEAGRALVLVLNMLDEARARGIRIDTARLERRLGCPVVATVATRRQGLRRLVGAIPRARRPTLEIRYPEPVEEALARLEPLLPEGHGLSRRSLALLVLQGDTSLGPWLRRHLAPETLGRVEAIRHDLIRVLGQDVTTLIWQARQREIQAILAETYLPAPAPPGGWSQRLGAWASHPVKGLVVLALVLWVAFWFVGLLGAGTLVDFLETVVFGQAISPASIRVADALLPFPHEHVLEAQRWHLELPLTPTSGIPLGLGREAIVPSPAYETTAPLGTTAEVVRFVHDLLVGPYGVVTMALAYGFAIILPIVGTFFILFGLLEDSGYLPRLAIMVNSLFRLMGLNGKAVLPLVLGLGCDTMATMTTRILDTRKQRIVTTLLLALVVPCSAQLGVLLAMMSRLSPMGAAIWAAVVLGTMVGVGSLVSRIVPGDRGDFLLEIPPMRLPVLGNIARKTLARMGWYLREVLPLFILGTLVLFLFDRLHVLGALRELGAPLVESWLGLPRETTEAFLMGFLRRDYGAVFLLQAATGPRAILDPLQILTSMIVITLFVPCIANVFMIIKEHGARMAVAVVAFVFPFAFLVGGLVARVVHWLGIPL
jgi:ferrous iron transport protein B